MAIDWSTLKTAEDLQAEADRKDRAKQQQAERKVAREQLQNSGPPPNSVEGLRERVALIEKALGLNEPPIQIETTPNRNREVARHEDTPG